MTTLAASPTISADATPADATQLWALEYLLAAQWQSGLGITTTWQSSVSSARSVAEQRWSMVDRPSRIITMPVMTFDAGGALQLNMLMARTAISRSLMPLVVDVTRLTTDTARNAVTLACDTRYRRLFAGGRIVIFSQNGGTVTAFEVATISSVTVGDAASGSLTLNAGTANAWTSGSRVMPLIEADLMVQQSANLLTDRHLQATITAQETLGPMSLPAISTPGVNPTGFDTYDGLPIFKLPANVLTPIGGDAGGTSLGVTRVGDFSNQGIARIGEFYGSRGRVGCTLPLGFLTRADAWDFLRFFDSRAGRTWPWWLISPVAIYQAVSIRGDGTGISVSAVGSVNDWTLRPYITLAAKDGTAAIRGVASVVRNAGVDAVTFDTAISIPPALSDLRRVSMAYKVRFTADELDATWHTTEHMTASIQAIEVLEEKSITVADVTAATSAAVCDHWYPADAAPVGPSPCYLRDGSKINPCTGDPVGTSGIPYVSFDNCVWHALSVTYTAHIFYASYTEPPPLEGMDPIVIPSESYDALCTWDSVNQWWRGYANRQIIHLQLEPNSCEWDHFHYEYSYSNWIRHSGISPAGTGYISECDMEDRCPPDGSTFSVS